MTNNRISRRLAVVALFALPLLAACEGSTTAPVLPDRDPEIAGVIREVRSNRVLVDDLGECGVWVSIPDRDHLHPASGGELKVGRYIKVWLPVGAAIGDSCPARATASAYWSAELKI